MRSDSCLVTPVAPQKVSRTGHANSERAVGPQTGTHASNGLSRDNRGHGLTDPSGLNDLEIGRGRSGIVYHSHDEIGRPVARKVFGSGGVTKVVQYVFSGAPNPYMWCESAVCTAVLRRRILATLVPVWFGPKLRVARAHDYRWNATSRAFEMRCELIRGRHVALHHPYTSPDDCEMRDAVQNVMKPLQARLAESGFDGLVWQAGRGNPVALNNFMCEARDENGGRRWVWIDLESGVPALIPINPVDLLLFYLPKSLRHGRPLFDDVDVPKLRAYVNSQRKELEDKLIREDVEELESDIDALERSQREWKSLARSHRSITYRHVTGSISKEQANWYAQHPLYWYGREIGRGFRSTWSVAAACVKLAASLVARIRPRRWFTTCWATVRSQEYRTQLAKDYIATRIVHWQNRGQLDRCDADTLRDRLGCEEASSYLGDFGVHLAVKPLVKMMEWWIVPTLWATGFVDSVFLGLFMIAAGPCVRTIYTLFRIAQNTLAGREKPWAALLTGVVPVVGNLAYPVQIISSGIGAHTSISQFILYDTLAKCGRLMPIWGGPDTLTEHILNRLPDIMRSAQREPSAERA